MRVCVPAPFYYLHTSHPPSVAVEVISNIDMKIFIPGMILKIRRGLGHSIFLSIKCLWLNNWGTQPSELEALDAWLYPFLRVKIPPGSPIRHELQQVKTFSNQAKCYINTLIYTWNISHWYTREIYQSRITNDTSKAIHSIISPLINYTRPLW